VPVLENRRPGVPAFACEWRDGGAGAAWVHVFGELDIATAPQVERALAAASLDARLVVLDLRGLTFMDSAGMHAIVAAADLAWAEGRQFIAVRGAAHVDRVFTLAGTHDRVEMFDLGPAEPPAQALLHLARRRRAR